MNLPTDFIDYTCSLIGKNDFEELASALEQPQPVSIRLNNKLDKVDTDCFTDKVKWCESGRYLDHRLTFTFDPLFHSGCYYVQEASSMFIEQVFKQYVTEPSIILDLCAAPGGKSTLVSSICPKDSLLVSNEILKTRSQILAENLMKWGNTDTIVTNNAPIDFAPLKGMFDILLTDMPCSGEGMFRKDEGAIREWSSQNVKMCAERQREIIKDCWSCLNPGGLLLYSTCTFNTLENEENIQWIMNELGAEALPIETDSRWNITGNLLKDTDFPVYRFLPHRTRGEGFFLAVLRKNGESFRHYKKERENKKHLPPIAGIKDLMTRANSWIIDNECYKLSTDGKIITAFSKQYAELAEKLSKTLHIVNKGVTIGEIKGHDLIPSQALAFSKIFKKEAFSSQEISYEQAISYLRKESILLDAQTPHGCVLLTYKDMPLGFVKNMGNRTNNLYPNEWRIRSSYLPEKIQTLL